MSRCLVLFVEGSTEVEFYKELIMHIRENHPDGRLDHKIICRNVKGIGGFKREVKRIFMKDILNKYEKFDFIIALCRDTDVFDYVQKPKINWNEVEDELKCAGAKKVIHIRAVKSIEDWFLCDLENVNSFLKLKQGTRTNGQSGYEKLKNQFGKANKIYTKGADVKGFVQSLDIDKICACVSEEIYPLYRELGIKMKSGSGKKR